jgi:hypothetical protein
MLSIVVFASMTAIGGIAIGSYEAEAESDNYSYYNYDMNDYFEDSMEIYTRQEVTSPENLAEYEALRHLYSTGRYSWNELTRLNLVRDVTLDDVRVQVLQTFPNSSWLYSEEVIVSAARGSEYLVESLREASQNLLSTKSIDDMRLHAQRGTVFRTVILVRNVEQSYEGEIEYEKNQETVDSYICNDVYFCEYDNEY